MIYALVIFGALALDRFVKMLVTGSLDAGGSIPVLGDFFHITYVQNTGVAFSLLAGHPGIILAATAFILSARLIFLVLFHKRFPRVFNMGVSLVCGGGICNVIDRKAYGYVIDMLDFGSFPVFNIADICVCVGCGLILLYVVRSCRDDEGD